MANAVWRNFTWKRFARGCQHSTRGGGGGGSSAWEIRCSPRERTASETVRSDSVHGLLGKKERGDQSHVWVNPIAAASMNLELRHSFIFRKLWFLFLLTFLCHNTMNLCEFYMNSIKILLVFRDSCDVTSQSSHQKGRQLIHKMPFCCKRHLFSHLHDHGIVRGAGVTDAKQLLVSGIIYW